MVEYLSYCGTSVYSDSKARKRVAKDFMKMSLYVFADKSGFLPQEYTSAVVRLRELIEVGAFSSTDAYRVLHDIANNRESVTTKHYKHIVFYHDEWEIPYSHFSLYQKNQPWLWQKVKNLSTTVFRSVAHGFNFVRDYIML